jgi:hypothetical protein
MLMFPITSYIVNWVNEEMSGDGGEHFSFCTPPLVSHGLRFITPALSLAEVRV